MPGKKIVADAKATCPCGSSVQVFASFDWDLPFLFPIWFPDMTRTSSVLFLLGDGLEFKECFVSVYLNSLLFLRDSLRVQLAGNSG